MQNKVSLNLLGFIAASCVFLFGCSEQSPESNAVSASAESAGVQNAEVLAELQQKVILLRQQAERVRSANEIKRLQRTFGYYFDEGLWSEMAALFSDDAAIEYARDGEFRGKARILEYLHAMGGSSNGLAEGELNEHFQLMPVVTLSEDGTSAKGRWRDVTLKGQYGEWAWWGEGPYENEYVLEDGVWKISRLHWFQSVMVPYEGGWGEHEDVNAGHYVPESLTADAPMSIEYEPWPETFLPPFHFANPVAVYLPEEEAQ